MNVKTIKTNDMNKKGILTIVMIAMFAMPMEARADGFSWDAGTKTLTVTGTDIANNPAWPIVIGGTSVEKTDVEHLVIGSGVTSIGDGAFKNCTNLKTASISNDVRSMGSSAFYDCKNLTTINIPQNEDFTCIQNDAFSGCTSLTSITLPEYVVTIGDRCFYGCSGMTSADLGLVKAIGSFAFYNCSSLPTISLPTTLYLEKIGDNAFASCTSLQTVRTYYFNQDNFGNRVFPSSMKGVIIPSIITNITKAKIFATFPSLQSSGDVFYEGTKSKCEQAFNENFNNTIDKDYHGAQRNKTFFNINNFIHWLCTTTFDTQGMAPNPTPVTNLWAGLDSVRWVEPPVVEGYEFGGWYWDEACTEFFGLRWNKDGSMIPSRDTTTIVKETIYADVIPGDVTLYAKWIPTYYFEVAFDTRGKGTNVSSQNVSLNKSATEPFTQYYRDPDDGKVYEIEGWYTDAGCTQRYDFSTPVDHSFTLYAKWGPATTAMAHVTITATGDRGYVWLTDATGRNVDSGMVPAGIYTLNINTLNPYSYGVGRYLAHGSIVYIPRPSQEGPSTGGSQSGESGEAQIGTSPIIDIGNAGEVVPADINPTIIDLGILDVQRFTYQIDLTSQDADITVNFVNSEIEVNIPISPADGGYWRCIRNGRGDNVCNLTATAKPGYVFRMVNLTKSRLTGSVALTPASATSVSYDHTVGPFSMQFTFPYNPDALAVNFEAIFLPIRGNSEHENFSHAPYFTKQPIGMDLPLGYAGNRMLTVEATSDSGQPSYQWYQHTENSYGGTAIDGANESSYTIPAGLPAGTTYYYCEVSVSRLEAKSDIVAVTIGGATGAATRGATATVPAADYPDAVDTASAVLTSGTTRTMVTRAPTDLSGKCGYSLNWAVSKSAGSDEYDVLTISGYGAVMRLLNQEEYPWYGYGGTIRRIVVEDGVTTIGSDAFKDFSGVTSLVLGKDVKIIGTRAFEGLTNLESVVLGDQVKYIGTNAFHGCTKLSALTFGAGLETIEPSAFEGLTSLESVALGDQVKIIGSSAFYRCTNLASLTLGAGLTNIGKYAFIGCDSLKTITVADGNTTFDSRGNCNAIIETGTNKLLFGCRGTVIPETVTAIGELAFAECSTLTSIDIPDAVTAIGEYAFKDCTALTSVTIPANVRLIDWDAFLGCSGLTDVYCYAEANGLTWNDGNRDDFISGETAKTTICHVMRKAPYVTAWGVGRVSDVNVTFVGDLDTTSQPEPVNTTATVTFPAGLSTYYDDQGLALDDETNGDKLTFYTVSAVGESSVTLTEIDTKKIPALTPVIVKNTGDGEIETDMTVDNTIAVMGYDSQFKGTVTGLTIPASGNGVNYYGFNGTDFIWIRDGGDVAPHRCWLMVGEESGGMVIGGGARRLSIEWPAGTTGIRSMEHEDSRIESRAGAWYDLRGQRLIGRPARKGVYVHQGKKVVIK